MYVLSLHITQKLIHDIMLFYTVENYLKLCNGFNGDKSLVTI